MNMGEVGLQLAADLRTVVSAVTAFADPLVTYAGETTWRPTERRWIPLPN